MKNKMSVTNLYAELTLDNEGYTPWPKKLILWLWLHRIVNKSY